MVAFLTSLTDPCLKDRACFGRWIPAPSEAPDGHQLDAVDASGAPL
jgi:cytochrome c peroxidase